MWCSQKIRTVNNQWAHFDSFPRNLEWILAKHLKLLDKNSLIEQSDDWLLINIFLENKQNLGFLINWHYLVVLTFINFWRCHKKTLYKTTIETNYDTISIRKWLLSFSLTVIVIEEVLMRLLFLFF